MSDPCKTHSPEKKPSSKENVFPEQRNGGLFWAITGKDFGRSITWSKRQENAISAQIKTGTSSGSPKTK
ncbi:MAG TPA: hypothetical protein VG838_04205 [Opitutaceae bacterium]|nr:hypothetical protein [Opitutaceae bacterium]